MSWTFTQVVHDAEDISEETVKAAVGTWLTEEESTLHIPAAVAAAKALVGAFKEKLPANVTLTGHSGVDPSADPSNVNVSVVVPPKPKPVVAPVVEPEPEVAAPVVAEAEAPGIATEAPAEDFGVEPASAESKTTSVGEPANAPVAEDSVEEDVSEARTLLEKAEKDAEDALARAKADLAGLV